MDSINFSIKRSIIILILITSSVILKSQITVKNSGLVGIGTSSPLSHSKLTLTSGTLRCLWLDGTSIPQWGHTITSVVSNNDVMSYVVNNGYDRFFVNGLGDIYYRYGWVYSDSTLKRNIVPLNNSLEKVLKLKGVSYNYIDKLEDSKSKTLNSKKTIGFIAQEVEKIVPEIVNTTNDGIKVMNYQIFTALLAEAIKELNLKVEELEAVIKSNGESEKLQINNDFKSNTVILPKLYQNAPNPFTEKTVIKYVIPENVQKASILIFNMQGTLMKSYDNLSNKRELTINGGELEAGMYMYSLIVDGKEVDTKKMILSK